MPNSSIITEITFLTLSFVTHSPTSPNSNSKNFPKESPHSDSGPETRRADDAKVVLESLGAIREGTGHHGGREGGRDRGALA